jgi:hypothetical protein
MPKYLLVARDDGRWQTAAGDMSPKQMQEMLQSYGAWSERVAKQGKLKGGEKLRDGQGRVVRGGKSGLKVTDGPFTESKEVMGGYWVLEASDYDDVAKLVQDHPHLQFGSLEIREIEDMGRS